MMRRSRLLVAVALGALLTLGCRRAEPASCDEVPTTADGCRERCHDRGAEMTFFRFDPDAYRCEALCLCGND